VRVGGQIRNAFSLAALHYNVPVRRIVELAPLLFVLAAEASLKRRRDKLAELEVALDRASDHWWQIPHLPSSAAELKQQREVIEAERKSIAARDLFGDLEFGDEFADWDDLYAHDSGKENPFAVHIRELAEGVDKAAIEALGSSSDITDYNVCWSEALDWACGDKWLAAAIQCGYVPVHEILRELEVPEHLWGREWTPEGIELRLQRVRSMADRWKEEIDMRTDWYRPGWMNRFRVPQVRPKSQLLDIAGGDEALAEKLAERMRSGRAYWREMPEGLHNEGAEAKRVEWLHRFVEEDDSVSDNSPLQAEQEKTT
jgi:hypothetical protein